MIFFMIPFVIVSSFIYLYYTKYVDIELNASLQSSFEKTKNSFNNVLSELDKYYMFFRSDEYVKMYIKLSKNNMHTFSNYNLFYQSNRLMKVCINTSSYLNSIYLYNINSGYVTASQYSSNIDFFYDKAWYDEFSKTQNPNFVISHYEKNTNVNIISFCYGIYGEHNNLDGIIVFNVDSERLSALLQTKQQYAFEEIRLTDSSGIALFSTAQQKIGEIVCENIADLSDNVINTKRTEENVIISSALDSKNLYLTVLNNLSAYKNKTIASNVIFIIMLLLLCLIAPLLISLYLSSNFYTSIAEIVTHLQQANGAESNSESFDELKYINQNIINIITNKENIEKELIEKVSALKKSQAIALQSQLNPHFLFNTLNAISVIYSNLVKERNDAEILNRHLSDILYFSLNTKENIINVSDEILYIKKYIEIERIKYENAFDVEWSIGENVYDLKTLKFVLQPIVENAFEHGLKYQTQKRKTLTISAIADNKNLSFIVMDNGPGMPKDKLDEIKKSLELKKLPEDKHIGICNVNMRIQLIFGDEYGIKIKSSQLGTTVKISMPIIKQG